MVRKCIHSYKFGTCIQKYINPLSRVVEEEFLTTLTQSDIRNYFQ